MKVSWHIIGLILSVKVATAAVIIFSFFLLPFGKMYYVSNFIYPANSPITLKTAFSTWDAQHYLALSERGYSLGPDTNAFPPLFPFLMYLLTFFTKNSFISGLLLAQVCSIVSFYLFYVLTKKYYNEKIAYKSLLFFLAFPTSFFSSLIYTESLFLLLVMLFFIFLERKKLISASLVAACVPLSRLIGIGLIVPFFVSYLFNFLGHTVYTEVAVILRSLLRPASVIILSPLVGLVFYMAIMWLSTGNMLTMAIAQRHFISQYSFFSVVNPLVFLHTFLSFPLSLHGFTNSILDRLFFLFFIFLLPFMARRVPPSFFVYSLVFGLVSILSGSFMSYMRYLFVVFPIFICLGKMTSEKKYQGLTYPLLFFSILLQSLFITMHSLNYWVA